MIKKKKTSLNPLGVSWWVAVKRSQWTAMYSSKRRTREQYTILSEADSLNIFKL